MKTVVALASVLVLSACGVTGGLNYDGCNDPRVVVLDCEKPVVKVIDGGVNLSGGNFVNLD